MIRLLFAKLDRIVERLNRFIGGLSFMRGNHGLPGSEPILWREKRARALARPEYLVRLFVALLIPVVGSWFGLPWSRHLDVVRRRNFPCWERASESFASCCSP
jgi:hypothetical protein